MCDKGIYEKYIKRLLDFFLLITSFDCFVTGTVDYCIVG